MAFPTKLRECLGRSFVITIGLDSCLYVYSVEEWEIFTGKIKSLTSDKSGAAKMFIVNACLVTADKQGRILIPQNLREHASLEKDITVLGVINRAEIWDTEKFRAYSETFDNKTLSEAVSEIAL